MKTEIEDPVEAFKEFLLVTGWRDSGAYSKRVATEFTYYLLKVHRIRVDTTPA